MEKLLTVPTDRKEGFSHHAENIRRLENSAAIIDKHLSAGGVVITNQGTENHPNLYSVQAIQRHSRNGQSEDNIPGSDAGAIFGRESLRFILSALADGKAVDETLEHLGSREASVTLQLAKSQ